MVNGPATTIRRIRHLKLRAAVAEDGGITEAGPALFLSRKFAVREIDLQATLTKQLIAVLPAYISITANMNISHP